MPVTFKVTSYDANLVVVPYAPESPMEFFRQAIAPSVAQEILQTSLDGTDANSLSAVCIKQNGLVGTIVDAYNHHHHLIIRPDDIWIAILAQFSFYVKAHAEELRPIIVQHLGKMNLTVEDPSGTRYNMDFGSMAKQMTKEIGKHVIDRDLRSWILPNFSTTSHTDTVVCAGLMMSTLRQYFGFRLVGGCGIPSMTLEGSKSDWEQILSRIDKFQSFGPEPSKWATMLRPILRRIVDAFDGNIDGEFFSRICQKDGTTGPVYLSGWLTAFCVWDSNGKWQGPVLSGPQKDVWIYRGQAPVPILSVDGVSYTPVNFSAIPPAYCDAEVLLDDNGEVFDCKMVSGLMGCRVVGDRKDSLRALPTWCMYTKGQGRRK